MIDTFTVQDVTALSRVDPDCCEHPGSIGEIADNLEVFSRGIYHQGRDSHNAILLCPAGVIPEVDNFKLISAYGGGLQDPVQVFNGDFCPGRASRYKQGKFSRRGRAGRPAPPPFWEPLPVNASKTWLAGFFEARRSMYFIS